MKISKTTLDIFKNFMVFNQHLVVNAGNVVRVVNEKKTTLIKAVVEDEFPVDFAVHDLGNFLKTIGLFTDPDFDFGEKLVTISDESGAKQTYYYSDREDLIFDEREVNFPEADITIPLPFDTLSRVLKAAGVQGFEDIAIVGEDSKVFLKALDKEKKKKTFSVLLLDEDKGNFTVYLKHSKAKGGNKLTLLPLDYVTEVSAHKIVKFSSKVEEVELSYIMAVEADSEI